MKQILAILAAVALMPQLAHAQIDQCPWCNVNTMPPTIGVVPSPALKPIPLPPIKYDHEYRGGQVIVTRWHDYTLLRLICQDNFAIACSYRAHNEITGEEIACLIMLGPMAWNDERALRHEIGHCNGWLGHEGAR
jgi:hypothetical protein